MEAAASAPHTESAAARLARLFQVYLILSAGVTAALLVLAWGSIQPQGRLLTAALLALILVVGFLSRLGWTQSAAVVYLAGLWLYVTLSLWLFGAFRSPAATAYAVVALGAALLFGLRGGAVSTAVIVVSSFAIAVADLRGWLPAAQTPETVLGLFVFLACLLSVVAMALLATDELRRAIADLRTEVQERRSAEERLRDSEARFRSIVDSSPMGIHLYRLEPPDRLVFVGANPAGDRILGFAVNPLAGRTIEEAFPGLAGTDVPGHYRRICSEGGTWASEVAYADGRVEGVYAVNAFQTAPGMMAAMFLDVTERRRAEEERERLEEQLRQSQKMEAVGRLAGGVAHDFNNLLMVIMGHGELLRRGLEADDPRLRKVQHVMGAAERAARLVRQLLAFSRKQVLEPQVVDLNALVSDTARMLRPLLGEDVRIVTRLAPALGRVRVDPAQIDQVLMNLAVNARDAMPRGGTLSLETANVAAPPGSPAGPANHVVLLVRDTGLGMDETTRAHLFEPFFTTKGGSGGTGLGLSMVYGIVWQSGGQVTVDSEPGLGTSFRIVLPRRRARRRARGGGAGPGALGRGRDGAGGRGRAVHPLARVRDAGGPGLPHAQRGERRGGARPRGAPRGSHPRPPRRRGDAGPRRPRPRRALRGRAREALDG
jgi:PAS domain S-box-containing protein